MGAPSLGQMIQARKHRYVITRDPNYQLPKGLEASIICADYMELVDRYKDSDEELLIVGGLTIFKLFTPYATSLDVAEANELVPGDLVFTEWDDGSFEVAEEKERDGFRVVRYTRFL